MSPDRYLRPFDIVGLLTRHKEGLRLTEIRESLGLPISSLHNILQTMVAAEILTPSDDLRYYVGPRRIGVALASVSSLDVHKLETEYERSLGHVVKPRAETRAADARP